MRNVRLIPIALGLCTLLPVSVASAESPDGRRAGETTSYTFEDDLVAGDLVRPDMDRILVPPRGRRHTLIRAREHFVPEMMESVEDL